MPKKLLIKDIFHHRGTKCPGHTRSRPHGGTRGKARFWPSNSCGDGRHWHMKMPVWLDRLNIWWFPLLKKCKLVVFAGSVNWELSVFRFLAHLSAMTEWESVHLLKHCIQVQIWGTSTLLEYFYFLLLYTSAQLHFGGKFCSFYSSAFIW